MQKQKNNLHYSLEAQNDLDEIWEYVLEELQNPQGARNTLNGILDAVDKLKDFAELGSTLTSITNIQSEYRFLVCGNYLAFYRVTRADIYIDRILYKRRDYLRVLFDSAD